jgi:hypothetical protein
VSSPRRGVHQPVVSASSRLRLWKAMRRTLVCRRGRGAVTGRRLIFTSKNIDTQGSVVSGDSFDRKMAAAAG